MIGGTIEAKIHHNQIHLQLSPLGGLNVSPQVGDVIDWKTFESSTLPTIKFSGKLTPCDVTSDNKCKIKSEGPHDGLYLYTCNGDYDCSDPGVGPITTTNPNSLFGLVEALKSFLISIKQFFFSKTSSDSTVRTSVAGSQGITLQGPQALPPKGPYQIDCVSGATMALPVLGSLGKTIGWGGPQKFTLKMTNVTCTQSTSTSDYVQRCTLATAVPGQPYSYTATVDNCSESTPQTITIQ